MLPVLALRVLVAASTAGSLLPSQDAAWDETRSRAKALAEHAYAERRVDDLPEWLAKLDYDGYRNLRFRPACMLWAGEPLPFCVQFHHRGYIFKEKTAMWEISAS